MYNHQQHKSGNFFMPKSRLLATTCLCATAFFLATPVTAMNEPGNSSMQFTHQVTVSDSTATSAGEQAIESDDNFLNTAIMSDEAWLFCSALLALAGIVIIHKTTQ